MHEFIRNKRIRIDALIIAVASIGMSRELSLVKTSLQTSQMFFGKVLGELGEPTPYPQADNHTNQIIEKRADQADESFLVVFPHFEDGDLGREANKVEKIKFLRGLIEDLLKELGGINQQQGEFFTHAKIKLTEAKLWLGMELNTWFLNEEQYKQDLEEFERRKYEAAYEAYERFNKAVNPDGSAVGMLFSNFSEDLIKGWKEIVSVYIAPPENQNYPSRTMNYSGYRY